MSIKGKRQARAWLFERAAHLLEEDREESGMTEAEERLVAGEVSHVTAKIRAAKPTKNGAPVATGTADGPSPLAQDQDDSPISLVGP